MRVLPALFLVLLLIFPAEARLKTGPVDAGSGHRLKSGTVVDAMRTSLSVAYSFRKVVPAYVGPSVRLVRWDTLAEADIGFTSSGDFDRAAALAHCGGPHDCYMMTAYDQSGNGRHATQAVHGNRPQLFLDCLGIQLCARSTWAGIGLGSASIAWVSTKTSLSAVARRGSGTGPCYFVGKNINYLYADTANVWSTTDFTSGSWPSPAADGAWHVGSTVIQGGGAAGSVSRIDGVETAGAALTGSAAAGGATFNSGSASTTCDDVEAMIWDGYALTSAERIALADNQWQYWGTP
jgi:hypothetical protein